MYKVVSFAPILAINGIGCQGLHTIHIDNDFMALACGSLENFLTKYNGVRVSAVTYNVWTSGDYEIV